MKSQFDEIWFPAKFVDMWKHKEEKTVIIRVMQSSKDEWIRPVRDEVNWGRFYSLFFSLLTDMLTLAHWKTECFSRNKITTTTIASDFFTLVDSFLLSSSYFFPLGFVFNAKFSLALFQYLCNSVRQLSIFLLCHILFLILLFWMLQ